MDKKSRKELLDLCVEIFACSELDYEVTLAGNGTNAAEAANVAVEILNILGLKSDDADFWTLVESRMIELKSEYGDIDFDDEESDEEEYHEIEPEEPDTLIPDLNPEVGAFYDADVHRNSEINEDDEID